MRFAIPQDSRPAFLGLRLLLGQLGVLMRMDAPGAFRLLSTVLTIPSEPLEFLTEVSALRRFDLGLARSYSWDGFRAAPLIALRRRGVPLTAFVRPSSYQREETLTDPPRGTGRAGYRPNRLPGVELALHFGAPVGPDLWPSVDDPYTASPFGEGIPLQRRLLEEEIGGEVQGARLHNEWRFTLEMFERIEAAGVAHDSTTFLGWIDQAAVRASPVGNCLPYSLVLRDGPRLRFARYIELPVSGYEHDELPILRLEKEGLPIQVSQHPDSTGVNLPCLLLAGDHPGRWYVTYGTLAHWWKERARIQLRSAVESLTASDAPNRWYLAVYPPQTIPVAGFECTFLRDRGGERLITLQSTSQSTRTAADAPRTGVAVP